MHTSSVAWAACLLLAQRTLAYTPATAGHNRRLAVISTSTSSGTSTAATSSTTPAPNTCGGCNLEVVDALLLSFPDEIVYVTSTIEVIPYITIYSNGTNVTSYSTVTDNATTTLPASLPTGTDHLTWTFGDAILTYPTTYIVYDPAAIYGGLELDNGDGGCYDDIESLPALTDAPLSNFIVALPTLAPGQAPIEVDQDVASLLPSPVISFLAAHPTYKAAFSGHDLQTCTIGTNKGRPKGNPKGIPSHMTQGSGYDGNNLGNNLPPPVVKSSVLVLQTSTNAPVYHTVNSPQAENANPKPSNPAGVFASQVVKGASGGGLGGIIAAAVQGSVTPPPGAAPPAVVKPAVITQAPTYPAAINVGGQVITANSQGGFVVAPGTTLTPGGSAVVVAGTTVSIGYSPAGATIAVVNGQTSTIAAAVTGAYGNGTGVQMFMGASGKTPVGVLSAVVVGILAAVLAI